VSEKEKEREREREREEKERPVTCHISNYLVLLRKICPFFQKKMRPAIGEFFAFLQFNVVSFTSCFAIFKLLQIFVFLQICNFAAEYHFANFAILNFSHLSNKCVCLQCFNERIILNC